MSNKFLFQAKNGGMSFNDYTKARFKDDLKANENARYEIKRLTPESRSMRGFLHGAVYPLWAWLDGKEHRDPEVIRHIHDIAKLEFNGSFFILEGKSHKVSKSTKGVLLLEYIERVITNLEEQYGINRAECLDPNKFKAWRDKMLSDHDSYIEYLQSIGSLSKPQDFVPKWRQK